MGEGRVGVGATGIWWDGERRLALLEGVSWGLGSPPPPMMESMEKLETLPLGRGDAPPGDRAPRCGEWGAR